MQKCCINPGFISLVLFSDSVALLMPSQSATPHLMGYLTILHFLLQLSSYIIGFTFLFFFYAIFCWIFSRVAIYDTHRCLSTVYVSVCLSVYHTIILSIILFIYLFKMLNFTFFQTCSQIYIPKLMKQFQWVSLTSYPAGIFLDTNPNCPVHLSIICMTKEPISFKPHLLFVTGGKKELQRHFKFQFSGKMCMKKKKLE